MMEPLEYYFWDEENQVENFSHHAFPSEDIWDKFQLVRFLTPPQGVEGSRRVWSTRSSLDDDVDWIHQFLQRDQDIDEEDQFCQHSRVKDSARSVDSVSDPACNVSSLSEDLDCVDPNDVLSFPGISGCEMQEFSRSDSQMDPSDDENYTAEETIELDVEDEQQEDRSCQLVNSEIPAVTAEQQDFVDPSLTSVDSFVLQQQPDYTMPTPDTLIPDVPLSNIIQEAFIQAVQPQQDTSLCHPWPAAAFTSHSSHLTAFTAPSQTVSSFPPFSLSYSQCPPQEPHSLSHVTNPQYSDCQNTHEHCDQDFLRRKRQSDLREFFRCLARYPMPPVTRNEVLLRLLQRLLQRTEELTAS